MSSRDREPGQVVEREVGVREVAVLEVLHGAFPSPRRPPWGRGAKAAVDWTARGPWQQGAEVLPGQEDEVAGVLRSPVLRLGARVPRSAPVAPSPWSLRVPASEGDPTLRDWSTPGRPASEAKGETSRPNRLLIRAGDASQTVAPVPTRATHAPVDGGQESRAIGVRGRGWSRGTGQDGTCPAGGVGVGWVGGFDTLGPCSQTGFPCGSRQVTRVVTEAADRSTRISPVGQVPALPTSCVPSAHATPSDPEGRSGLIPSADDPACPQFEKSRS